MLTYFPTEMSRDAMSSRVYRHILVQCTHDMVKIPNSRSLVTWFCQTAEWWYVLHASQAFFLLILEPMCTFMENVVSGNKLAASIQQRMKATRQAATFFIQASKVISLSLDQLTYQFTITITFMLTCFISTQKPTSEYVIKLWIMIPSTCSKMMT